MSKGILSFFLGAVLVASLSGCGDGGGGSGGSGGSTGSGGSGGTDDSTSSGGSGGSTSSGSGGSTSSGSGGDTGTTTSATGSGTICEELCAAGKTANCYDDPVSTCVTGCNEQYQQAPACTAQLDVAYQCILDKVSAGNCQWDALCPAEVSALNECITATGCGVGTCSASATACSCTATCNGADVEVACEQTATGSHCACSVNGAIAGTCDDVDLSCSLENGCCSQFF